MLDTVHCNTSIPCFSFQNLGKQFAYHWAIQEISGEIKNGGRVAILGKNGAGKSTLLGLLAGFYRPTSGSIQFSDKNNISFIGHESMLYSQLTVLENLFFFQALYPQSKKSNVMDALKFTDLYEFRNAKVETLSHGMKKYLNIARMLVQKPTVLILDEIFSGLDLKAKNFLRLMIQDGGFQDMNWSFDTLILVEHDINRSLECCNEFWLLQKGKLVTIFSKKNHSSKEIQHKYTQFLETP